MDDCVHLAYMGQKLVAQSLAAGRALDESGNIDEFNYGGGIFFGIVHLSQNIEPFIRDCYDSDIRVDGTEGIIRGLGAGVRYDEAVFRD